MAAVGPFGGAILQINKMSANDRLQGWPGIKACHGGLRTCWPGQETETKWGLIATRAVSRSRALFYRDLGAFLSPSRAQIPPQCGPRQWISCVANTRQTKRWFIYIYGHLRAIIGFIARGPIIWLAIRGRDGEAAGHERQRTTADDQSNGGHSAARQQCHRGHGCRLDADTCGSGGPCDGPGPGEAGRRPGHLARLQGGLDAFC